jgi:acyl-CoA reductase-like NAD-dependent aldehyde dehydrogenase
MTGLKYKLAHRRAEKEKWNATDNTQRKRLIQILQELIDQLKKEMVETTR